MAGVDEYSPEWVKNMPEYRFDGAFGTLYQSRGGREEICEAADLREPTLVAGIRARLHIRRGGRHKDEHLSGEPARLP